MTSDEDDFYVAMLKDDNYVAMSRDDRSVAMCVCVCIRNACLLMPSHLGLKYWKDFHLASTEFEG